MGCLGTHTHAQSTGNGPHTWEKRQVWPSSPTLPPAPHIFRDSDWMVGRSDRGAVGWSDEPHPMGSDRAGSARIGSDRVGSDRVGSVRSYLFSLLASLVSFLTTRFARIFSQYSLRSYLFSRLAPLVSFLTTRFARIFSHNSLRSYLFSHLDHRVCLFCFIRLCFPSVEAYFKLLRASLS